MWKFIQLMVLASLTVVLAQDTTNNSTECPRIPGFFYRDGCKLLCRPATWTDVVIFYLGNYIAHAATVITQPGQNWRITAQTIFTAILAPGVGTLSGLHAISTMAIFAPTKLQTAARAGALFTVIRQADVARSSAQNPESPPVTTKIDSRADLENEYFQLVSPFRMEINLNNEDAQEEMFPHSVHGACRLPPGYRLVRVPGNATFKGEDIQPWHLRLLFSRHGIVMPQTLLCCGYSPIRILASIVQLLFAISTLYNTRGDQIERYGYAAFGLTVVPYAWMSLINLIGNSMCPQYDTMFLVGSEAKSELETDLKRGVVPGQEQCQYSVDGAVGFLTETAYQNILCEQLSSRRKMRLGYLLLRVVMGAEGAAMLLSCAGPLVFIGILSGFHPGHSALYERVWTMMWLTLGFYGILVGATSTTFRMVNNWRLYYLFICLFAIVHIAVPIGGYVVVAQMILDFGSCVRVDS